MARIIWWIVGIAAAIAGLAVLSLALPVKTWRAGRESVAPLRLTVGGPEIDPAARLWIDSDAACGASERTDPDDCFAIALLLKSRGERIVGVSTVFGNASLETTDRTARQLVRQLAAEGMRTTNVYAGAADPFDPARPVDSTPAHKALQKALREGPLVIVALGPLSNVAAALHNRPDLQKNVTALIAVMGRRPGHIFHPTEGAGGAMLWGHGPIFRDFNFAQDEYAAASIVAAQLPLILIPYDAARDIMIGEPELAALSAAGGAWRWIADRARLAGLLERGHRPARLLSVRSRRRRICRAVASFRVR